MKRSVLFALMLVLPVASSMWGQEGGVVKGKVLQSNSYGGVPGATISITTGSFSKSTVSGDDGTFVLTGVPAGTHVVQLKSNLGADNVTVTVSPGQTVDVSFAVNFTGQASKFDSREAVAVPATAAPAAAPGKTVKIEDARLDPRMLVIDKESANPTPHVVFGVPGAPSTDTYYDGVTTESIYDYPPDEFISNPDPSIDYSKLKGYHYPPRLISIKVLNAVVRPGETVRFEARVEDVGKITPWFIRFQGPKGRRSELSANFRPRQDNPWIHDGTATITPWAEPGLYQTYLMLIANEAGHSKAYFQDYHPAMLNARFIVSDNPNVDVTPPELLDVRIGDEPVGAGQIPAFDITQPIPVHVKATDNLSGVDNIMIRITGPTGKYSEISPGPMFGEKNSYVAYLSLPPNREGGEYFIQSMWITDKAKQTLYSFPATNEKVAKARFAVRQEAAKIDTVAPKLGSIFFNKRKAGLEEEIQVTAVVYDDKSGVGTIAVNFAHHPSFVDHKRVHLKKTAQNPVIQKSGFNYDLNTWVGSFKIDKLDEPGDWVITRVMARDTADNLMDVRYTESKELQSVRVFVEGNGVMMPKATTTAPAQTAEGVSARPAMAPGAATPAGQKIRRIDMIPPHPPRGACLNCHEP